MNKVLRNGWLIISLLVGSLLLTLAASVTAQLLPVRVDRWLEVRQISGTVALIQGQSPRSAQVGNRLQSVGDGIQTQAASSATLAVDTGIGFIDIAENTLLRIQQLSAAPNGARITQLEVIGGQARLRLRQFTDSDSRLEIQTPAGISGVRGTTFGVSVQPDGKTGLATLEGQVDTTAQGRSVPVVAGFQNMTIPGEPPSPPVPLQDDARLMLRRLTAEQDSTVRIIGYIDPVNLLSVADQLRTVDRTGFFDLQIPLPLNRRIEATVTTPLGRQQAYELAVP